MLIFPFMRIIAGKYRSRIPNSLTNCLLTVKRLLYLRRYVVLRQTQGFD